MSDKLRCVAVGLGGRGQHLLQQVMQNPHYEVVALAEPNGDLLEKARGIAAMPPERCYTDLEAALTTSGAQVSVINTPPHLHTEHLEMSFAHGLHAFISKPLTRDFAGAQRIVELAEEKKLSLLIDQQQRFRPVERKVAEWVQNGRYGKLGFGTYTYYRNRPEMHNATNENPFLWEQGVHCFNSMLAMFDRRALTVCAHGIKPSWSRYNGPTVVMGVIEFEGSSTSDPIVPIQFIGSYASKVRQIDLHLEFDQAALKVEEGFRDTLSVAMDGGGYEDIPLEEPEDGRSGEQINLDYFYQAMREGIRVPNDGRDNLRTLAIVEAFIRSSQEGRVVKVADVG